MWKKKLGSKSGQAMSEYLILVVMLAVGAIAATSRLQTQVRNKLDDIRNQFNERVNFAEPR